MIRSLELTNYRGFEHYKLSDLARVNLLVGKNNSGKTSILEAVYLLGSRDNPDALFEIAKQRGEMIEVSENDYGSRKTIIDYSGFFYGRDIREGTKLSIRSITDVGNNALEAEIAVAEPREGGRGGAYADGSPLTLSLQFKGPDDARATQSTKRSIPLEVEADTALYNDISNFLAARRVPRVDAPVAFITQESLSDLTMRRLWDAIVLEGREREIVDAMRIIEPRLSSIAFLSGQRPHHSSRSSAGILLGFEKEQRRYPLGGHGEGMRRLLALALSLATARNGILLIDEVDTGLHYSVLGDVWLLIVKAAKDFNMQVFLTTHSLDCVRALGWLCEAYPELTPEVSLQKIERALDEAVAFSADQIQIAVEQGIEVR